MKYLNYRLKYIETHIFFQDFQVGNIYDFLLQTIGFEKY